MFNALLVSTFIGVALAIPNYQMESFSLLEQFTNLSSGCPTGGPISCQNTASNSCCFESPGGLIEQTQFWDTGDGPTNSWTIHGLWPNNCDGRYSENCDPSRDYTDISTLLTDNGASSTLAYMENYWLNINGDNEELWAHEWATHGTCYSTLAPSCLPPGSPTGLEAVAFFETAVNLFQTLPTYTFLENAGITPSSTKTYTLDELVSALADGSGGYTPTLSCRGSTITGISWYFNLQGSAIDGTFIPISAPDSERSNCHSRRLRYPPKSE